MVEAGTIEMLLFLFSGASVALNTAVWYKLGTIETTLRLCKVCQHGTKK